MSHHKKLTLIFPLTRIEINLAHKQYNSNASSDIYRLNPKEQEHIGDMYKLLVANISESAPNTKWVIIKNSTLIFP